MDFPLQDMLAGKTLRVTLSTLTNFAHGAKTVGTSPVELYAGSQALAGRKKMIIVALGEIYIGKNTVTTSNGFPVGAGMENRFEIEFDPTVPVSIYAVAEQNTEVRIWEVA